MMPKWKVRVATIGLILSLSGCSGYRSYQHAQLAEQTEDWDQAVLKYLELIERSPGNIRYKAGLIRARINASQQHFKRGLELRDAGDLSRAVEELHEAVRLDSTNQYAQAEFEKVRDDLIAERASSESPALADLKEKNRGSRPQPPVLNPRSSEPISLSFPKPVLIFNIYKALGKAFGINIQFDSKVRGQDIAIELEQVTAQEALEILMRTAGHFYKVLNEHTILVAEDNAQNRRTYEDLVIQTFFLSNSDPKQVMQMLRSLVGTKNVAANEPLNAIVLRDTADKVKVAERIIATNDKSRGEVMIDVELLQINTSKLRELGASLSQYNITQSLDPNPVRVSDLEFINQGNWTLSIPSFIYDFVKNSSEAQLLASPQVRISDGEKATFHIGDRVPIPVTTFNTGQTVGGNIVPITSFQYQEVGIRLDIEPRIHHNKEITLDLKVEVSDISGTVQGSGGQQQPIIGTRNIESKIRLKDGETNFLAGLYQNNESSAEQGLPGLSDIPVIGRLFSRKSTDVKRTDLVLTLTPHIVRTADITEEDLMPIWVGTEANITFRR
jgi:general secretion pathway protein D